MPTCEHANMRICEHADMRACEHANMRICEYANMRTCEHANMRTCDHANMRICEHANMRICEYANMRTCEHANMRPCEHANMRTCEHANMRIASTPKSSSPSGLAVGDHLLDQRSSSEAVGWASPVTVGGALMSSSASSVATVYIDGDRFAVFAFSILQNCPGAKNKVTPAIHQGMYASIYAYRLSYMHTYQIK